MSRVGWYVVLNALFGVTVACATLSGSAHGVHPLYLLLLFAQCTTFVIDTRRWNDRNVLLALFSAVYFASYGAIECEQLIGLDLRDIAGTNTDVLSATELVIVCGGALVQLSYRLACRVVSAMPQRIHYDWSERSLLWVGIPLFLVCTWLNWINRVYFFVTADNAGTARGLAAAGSWGMVVFMLAATLQPLSMLLIFYAQCRFKRRYIMPLTVAVVLMQALYGFVADIKGEVLIGGVMLVLVKWLVDGKIPKTWLLAVTASIAILFPVLEASRVLRGEHNIDHTQAAGNITQIFKQAFAERNEVSSGDEGTQSFLERISLVGSVEMIVDGTGTVAPYQHGHTLTPLLAAFIPKIIWPSKPDVPTGQLLNKQFHVSEVEDTYISPSHLGELYWNFGWAGVIGGMAAIGLLFGYIGARYELSTAMTLTRLLIIAATARLLILGFEGAIASQYVVWMRSMLAVGLLHAVFAKSNHAFASQLQSSSVDPEPEETFAPAFPNLMR